MENVYFDVSLYDLFEGGTKSNNLKGSENYLNPIKNNKTMNKQSLTSFCCSVVFFLCLIVFIGWQFDIPFLTNILPGSPATTPLTAFLLVLISVSLLLSTPSISALWLKRLGMVICVTVGLFSLWLLIKYLLGFSPDIESVFYEDAMKLRYPVFQGRPSLRTLISALLISSTIGLSFFYKKKQRVVHVLALVSWIIPWLTLFGYASLNNPFYEFPNASQVGMSPITAICFLLLTIGVFGLDPKHGIINFLKSSPLGNRVVRILLPISVFAPLVFSWLVLYANNRGFFENISVISVDWAFTSLIFIGMVLLAGYFITDRDAKLKESENQYHRLVEDVQDYSIIMLDITGKVVSWNKGAESIKGYKESEIIGQHFSVFYTEEDKQANRPDSLLNEALRNVRVEDEGWRLRKNGNPFWANVVITAIFDQNKKHVGFSKVTRDQTLKKSFQEKIEVSERHFRQFLESAPDAMIIANAEGKIVYSNLQAHKLFGYSKEEFLVNNVEELMPGNFRSNHQKHRSEYMISPKVRMMGTGMELKGLKKDGTEFPIEIALSPIMTEEGLLVSAAIRDITVAKRAHEEIELLNSTLEKRAEEILASNKELEAFSYSVSHDLRAPLRAIAGFSNKLLRKHSDNLDDEGKRVVDVILKNTYRMGQLIDDILMFSRLNRTNISFTPLDLQLLFKEAYQNLIQAENSKRDIEFNVSTLPLIKGDRSTMMQAITNLVSNALKYTRPRQKTVINIGYLEKEGEITIFIKDNGVGFDDRHIDKLFGVFQRLHNDDEFEGTGVGLAIVQRVLHRHLGKIWAEGKIDQGATFYFQIPTI
ncbi:PAS domain S-box protein [Reichenbachiella sp. MALMAid0571]|uniref:PAS domain-containing sensor histidine kinase n=1 Tax=Reichenbachiella sp. MALMAid0571 TaxID=3143939 RepID=UPI0032E049AC